MGWLTGYIGCGTAICAVGMIRLGDDHPHWTPTQLTVVTVAIVTMWPYWVAHTLRTGR